MENENRSIFVEESFVDRIITALEAQSLLKKKHGKVTQLQVADFLQSQVEADEEEDSSTGRTGSRNLAFRGTISHLFRTHAVS